MKRKRQVTKAKGHMSGGHGSTNDSVPQIIGDDRSDFAPVISNDDSPPLTLQNEVGESKPENGPWTPAVNKAIVVLSFLPFSVQPLLLLVFNTDRQYFADMAGYLYPLTSHLVSPTLFTPMGETLLRTDLLSPGRIILDDFVAFIYLLVLLLQAAVTAGFACVKFEEIRKYKFQRDGKVFTGPFWCGLLVMAALGILPIADLLFGGLTMDFLETNLLDSARHFDLLSPGKWIFSLIGIFWMLFIFATCIASGELIRRLRHCASSFAG